MNSKNRQIDFVIAGAQKSGTTALDYYLRQHHQIEMAKKKEVHFFDNENIFNHQPVDYAAYHQNFNFNTDAKVWGEATPIYMYWQPAAHRMHQYNPQLKIILILRNPITRAFSHWNMERDRRADTLSFWDAISSEKQRCQSSYPLQHRVFSYTDRGFYSEQINRIWHYFKKSQTLILKHEDLKNKPLNTINKICDFLKIDKLESIEPKTVHARPYIEDISIRELQYLKDYFHPEIKKLETMLQWNCSDWY